MFPAKPTRFRVIIYRLRVALENCRSLVLAKFIVWSLLLFRVVVDCKTFGAAIAWDERPLWRWGEEGGR